MLFVAILDPAALTIIQEEASDVIHVLEKDSSVDPISLAKCTGDLLLNLGEVEG